LVDRLARGARTAGRAVARAKGSVRESALRAAAARIRERASAILAENRLDLDAGIAAGLSPAMLDRLALDERRLGAVADSVEAVAALPDPVGRIEMLERRPNGLLVGRMRIPLGVVMMVYESRPNVTADAFAVCLRAGNAVILRGGSEAHRSNLALGEALAHGLEVAGLPAAAAQVVPSTDRAVMEGLLARNGEIDLCIPRGGEGLIRFVSERARMPVIQHYKGVCHVYVDRAADLDMALAIAENAKVSRPGVCNACETILVHEAVAEAFVPRLCERLGASGVEIRGDERTRALGGAAVSAATEQDYGTEYLALIVAVRVVASFDEAVRHIETYGSSHTDAIVTHDHRTAMRFVNEVASATVLVNASTRFADGGELGLGAEIGISTSRLHAYGPMGAEELTTRKFIVLGDGHIRT
jgi:glutamate-5-semialdehyde dehydrogenase